MPDATALPTEPPPLPKSNLYFDLKFRSMFNDTLVTVWSAPNYCYRCGNVAAILELDENLTKFYKIFEAAPQEVRGAPAKKPAPDYFL